MNIRTDYWEVPEHDEIWAEKQRADFGDDEFAQEFELQFNVNSKMLLEASDMQFITRKSVTYVSKKIYTNSQYLNVEGLKWHPDFDPNNIDRNAKYVILVDLAEGNEDKDNPKKNKNKAPDDNTLLIFKVIPNSVANLRRFAYDNCDIKDCFRFVQIGKYASNTEDEIYAAKVASALTYELFQDGLLDNVRVCVEMNFNGKSFTSSFMQHPMYSESSLFKTYHTKPVPNETRKKKIGFKTTTDKEFYCLKFRSMRVNADADKVQATKDDPRKTKWGNIMRKTNIDELPQFINVLMGDMSVVGPRPHMVLHTEKYSKLINMYMVRHFVKPGITGWSQVTGFRGETKDISQMEGRVRGDIWYIEHWSFWLDLYIIFKTVANAIIGDKEAY